MSTRTVSMTIYHDDETPWAGGIVRWVLREAFATGATVQPEDDQSVTLDASGDGTIDLACPDTGTAHYVVILPDEHSHTIYLAAGPATDLQTLLALAGSPVSQDAAQTVIDAHVATYSHPGIDVRYYGAVGDGVTDDTTAIQNAIDACPKGSKVYIPAGLYKYTAALVCDDDITIEGEFATEIWGSNAVTFDGLPGSAPWVMGSVLLQSTAATNGINITGTGINVSLKNLAIRFADAIAFSNTGHGIYAVPTATISGGHDGGLANCSWDNLIVFGHDGNHYGYYTVNMILGKFEHLRSYGGGGWYQEVDSQIGNLGNSIAKRIYSALFAAGTAHGFCLKSRTTTFPGVLNMCVFEQPQCNLGSVYGGLATAFPTVTPANGAVQYLWKDIGNPPNVYIIAPDLECLDANPSQPLFGTGTYVQVAGGYFARPNGDNWNYKTKKVRLGVPTVTPDNGAGTVGTPTINVWCNDEMGIIDFITSQYPWGADSRVLTVTLESFPTIGMVLIQPYLAADSTINAVGVQFYIAHVTANSFDVYSHGGLAGETRYAFQFLVVE